MEMFHCFDTDESFTIKSASLYRKFLIKFDTICDKLMKLVLTQFTIFRWCQEMVSINLREGLI